MIVSDVTGADAYYTQDMAARDHILSLLAQVTVALRTFEAQSHNAGYGGEALSFEEWASTPLADITDTLMDMVEGVAPEDGGEFDDDEVVKATPAKLGLSVVKPKPTIPEEYPSADGD